MASWKKKYRRFSFSLFFLCFLVWASLNPSQISLSLAPALKVNRLLAESPSTGWHTHKSSWCDVKSEYRLDNSGRKFSSSKNFLPFFSFLSHLIEEDPLDFFPLEEDLLLCVRIFSQDLNNFITSMMLVKFEILIDSSHSRLVSSIGNSIFSARLRSFMFSFRSPFCIIEKNIIQSLSTINIRREMEAMKAFSPATAHKYSRVNSCYYF